MATRLDPRETNVNPAGFPDQAPGRSDPDYGIQFRHAGWNADRNRVVAALRRTATPTARLERFLSCGSNAWVVQHPDDPTRIEVHSDHCKDRYCLPCGQDRARRIASAVADLVGKKTHRFITLTLRHRQEPLALQLARIYRCFRALRATATWRNTQLGGVAFLELKYDRGTGLWHPHFHVLSHGRYLKKQYLSDAWHAVTGDSFIVDITLVRQSNDIVRYITKYASKPMDPSVYRVESALDEALVALRGRRLCFTYGDWRGIPLIVPGNPIDWIALDTLDNFRCRANCGDPVALTIMETLLCRTKPNRSHNLSTRGPPDTAPSDSP